MNEGYVYRDVVSRRFDGWTVLEFYCALYPKADRREWESRIERGLVAVNGETARPDTVVHAGDALAYSRPPWREPEVPAEFSVAYEDGDILVVEKPAGLPVLPGGGCLDNTLLRLVRRSSSERRGASPAHCLDRGTSGLVVFGKNRRALSRLGRMLRRRRLTRLYLAVVEGLVEADGWFSATAPIGPVEHPKLGLVYATVEGGKPARTDFVPLARDRPAKRTLVAALPVTGRPHQIRIHAAWMGHPLVGEPFYVEGGRWDERAARAEGRIPLPGDCGYRLHAWFLAFRHPSTGRLVRFVSAPAEDFREGLSVP